MFHTHTAAFHKHVLVPAVAAALTVTVLELMTCAPGPGRPGNFDEHGRAVMLEGRRSDWRFERYATCNTYTATAESTYKALCLTLLVAIGTLWTLVDAGSLLLFQQHLAPYPWNVSTKAARFCAGK
jgi:hypothetical protein